MRALVRQLIAAASAGTQLHVSGYTAKHWGEAINSLFDLENFDAGEVRTATTRTGVSAKRVCRESVARAR